MKIKKCPRTINEREITIIMTKGEKLGIRHNEFIGKYEILDKKGLLKRIEELTDEGYGYTILIAKKGGDVNDESKI